MNTAIHPFSCGRYVDTVLVKGPLDFSKVLVVGPKLTDAPRRFRLVKVESEKLTLAIEEVYT